ncbi:hypothetical protein OOK47_36925 [Streptomyces sp. NBC_00268]|nr:hypothetical protein [Streptomyces sp. NBC_00268]MCX5188097.1 hypothetical protein [Streptomyces sp. NBC_00268]
MAGGDDGHHLGPAAETTRSRMRAGDALAEDCEVRSDTEMALDSCHAKTESADDLVEDQQRAELVTQVAHLRGVALLNGHGVALRSQRLQ